jgi:hypothetical protein
MPTKAKKVVDTADRLRREIDAEKESSGALAMQVELLNKRLDDAKALSLSAAEIYTSVVASFGAVTPLLPSNLSAYGVLGLLKSKFSKLPDFFMNVADFVVVSSATNLSKTLAKSGCGHIKGLRKGDWFESSKELGEASRNVSRAVKNFISSFWFTF